MTRSAFARSLLLVLILSLFLSAPSHVLAATRKDAKEHQRKAAAARKEAARYQRAAEQLLTETKALESRIDKLDAEIGDLNGDIAVVSARKARLEGEIDVLRNRISQKEAEIVETQEAYDFQTTLLARRAESTYKQGDSFYLDLVLGSEDFTDLVSRASFIQRIIQRDHDIASGLAATKTTLQTKKMQFERDVETLSTKRATIDAEETELEKLRNAEAGKRDQHRKAQAEKSALYSEKKHNADRLKAQAAAEERESDKIMAELSGYGGSGRYNGVMAWPVPGYENVGSPFGPRMHPILHYTRMHTGIDIGAPHGAKIIASGSGKVIYSGYRGGYGNTVMIDHGNGVVTLYAHQSSIVAGNGSRVTRGEVIGRVGSTGMSTGPHLHFEVRVNGSPRNPMNYLD